MDDGSARISLYSEALKTVPFFLPNLFGSIVACVAGVLVYCFLPETLVGKREGDVPYGNVGDGTGESDDPETETGDVELVGTAAARDSDKEEGSVSNDTGKKLREDEVQIELSISARDSLRSSTDFAPVGVTAATDIDLRPRLKALPCGRRCRQIFGACTNREALAMIGLYSAHSFLAMFLDEMWPLWCLATPAVDGARLIDLGNRHDGICRGNLSSHIPAPRVPKALLLHFQDFCSRMCAFVPHRHSHPNNTSRKH